MHAIIQKNHWKISWNPSKIQVRSHQNSTSHWDPIKNPIKLPSKSHVFDLWLVHPIEIHLEVAAFRPAAALCQAPPPPAAAAPAPAAPFPPFPSKKPRRPRRLPGSACRGGRPNSRRLRWKWDVDLVDHGPWRQKRNLIKQRLEFLKTDLAKKHLWNSLKHGETPNLLKKRQRGWDDQTLTWLEKWPKDVQVHWSSCFLDGNGWKWWRLKVWC